MLSDDKSSSMENSLETKSWTLDQLDGLELLDDSSASASVSKPVDTKAPEQEDDRITEEAVEVIKKAGMSPVGSVKHGTSLCRPCHYVHCRDGCKDKEGYEF